MATNQSTVSVNVVDGSGAPVENARVTILPLNGNLSSAVLYSDSLGLAKGTLEYGAYNLSVSKEGYYSAFIESAFVFDGTDSELPKLTVELEKTR